MGLGRASATTAKKTPPPKSSTLPAPLDPLSYFEPGAPRPSRAPLDDDAQDIAIKARVKKQLIEAAPAAAKRLADISQMGEEKYAVTASEAILDRAGFSKSEPVTSNPLANLLSPNALIAALLGIGKVLGVREVSKLRNITPREDHINEEADESRRADSKRADTSDEASNILLHAPILRGIASPDRGARPVASGKAHKSTKVLTHRNQKGSKGKK